MEKSANSTITERNSEQLHACMEFFQKKAEELGFDMVQIFATNGVEFLENKGITAQHTVCTTAFVLNTVHSCLKSMSERVPITELVSLVLTMLMEIKASSSNR